MHESRVGYRSNEIQTIFATSDWLILVVTKVASVRYPGLATRSNACINITKAHLISVFLSDTELQSFLTDI